MSLLVRRSLALAARSSTPRAAVNPVQALLAALPRCYYAAAAKSIDWLDVQNLADDQLPDMPSDSEWAQEQKFWEEIQKKKTLPGVSEMDAAAAEMPKELIPHVRIAATPLSKVIKNKPVDQLELSRLVEIFKVHVELAKFELMLKTFIEIRKDGFVPPAEVYADMFPMLVSWSAFEAMDMLEKEVRELRYARSAKMLIAFVHRAIIKSDRAAVEKAWAELEGAKFDIHPTIYSHVLFFYTRYTDDLNAALAFYKKMQAANKVTDPTPGNILLDMCRVQKFYDIAYDVYTDMEKSGVLEVNLKKDAIKTVFEEEEITVVPKHKMIVGTYQLMAEISCDQGKEADVLKFVERSLMNVLDIFMTFVFTYRLSRSAKTEYLGYKGSTLKTKFVMHRRLYEKIAWMYLGKGDLTKARYVIEDMTRDKVRPSEALFRAVLVKYMTLDDPRRYLEFKYEFDLWGFQFDEELFRHLLNMWYRVKDDRQFVNTFNAMLDYGIKVNTEVRELLMKVYDRSGRFDDVQRFYDQQLLAGNEITPVMHTIMVKDYLAKGYPGSARQVVQRMAREGQPAAQDLISSIAAGYGEKAGGFQVLQMIEEDMIGKDAAYSLTAPILAAAMDGLSRITGEKAGKAYESARDAWEKFGKLISLDIPSASKLIRSFNALRNTSDAIAVYTRALDELLFAQNAESKDFFLAALQGPASEQSALSRYNVIKVDMKQRNVVPELSHYQAALKYCLAKAAVKDAVTIMKEFSLEFYGLPFQRGFITDFFTILARYDGGKYRREAMAWINRIVPRAKVSSFFILSHRHVDTTLDEIRDDLLSIVQSTEISKYIANIDMNQIVEASSQNFEELFTGSDVDVEDLLISEGYDEKAVKEQMAKDPDFVRFMAALRKLPADQINPMIAANVGLEEK